MKKTLITLAALAAASVASATTWTDMDSITASYVQNADGGDVFRLNAYTFYFTIPENILTTGDSAILAYINGADTDTTKQNRQFTYTLTATEDGTYTLTMGRSNLSDDISTLNWGGDSVTKTVENLTSGITYTVNSTGGDQPTIKVTSPDNSNILYTRIFSDGGQLVFLDTTDNNQTPTAKFNSAFAIPEPATATLSLLALAGLAARRRRK